MDADRRRRFRQFFEHSYKGDRARFMQETGLSKGRVTQLFDDDEPFGERAAVKLAQRLRLRDDYFERDYDLLLHQKGEELLITLIRTQFGADLRKASAEQLRRLADRVEQAESEQTGDPPPSAAPAKDRPRRSPKK